MLVENALDYEICRVTVNMRLLEVEYNSVQNTVQEVGKNRISPATKILWSAKPPSRKLAIYSCLDSEGVLLVALEHE